MDYELMDEERHAAAAIRLLAEEAGRMTTDGALAAPSRKSYQAAVGDARRKEKAGEALSDRERILAAAPLQWWIDMYSEGWSSLVQAAGVTPAWTRKTPRLEPIVATGKSTTAQDHIRPDDAHPPTPPTLDECREVLKALLAESLNGGRNHTAIQRAYRLIARIDAQPAASDPATEGVAAPRSAAGNWPGPRATNEPPPTRAWAGHLFVMAERLRQLAHAHPAPVQAHQQPSRAITFCATSFCTNRTEGAVGRDGQPICEDCRKRMGD